MSQPTERRQARQHKRMPASMERYVPLLAPLPANDEDPQGDEALRDALDSANSGTEAMNRSDE